MPLMAIAQKEKAAEFPPPPQKTDPKIDPLSP